MPRISIIGIGNTLRADDGVGVRVAEELSSRDLGAGRCVVLPESLLPLDCIHCP